MYFAPLLCILVGILLLQALYLPSKRERDVLDTVQAASAEFGVPVPLILAVIRTESNFRANARSAAGAVGLMQLLPETFLWISEEKLEENLPLASLSSAEVNVRYGTYYLAYLTERFGDLRTALAAYNAGEGRVAEWLDEQNGTLSAIPYLETRTYVDKVLRTYARYTGKYE